MAQEKDVKKDVKQEKREKEVKVLKGLELADGEIDIRELSDTDFKQIVFRFLSALLEHASIQTKTLSDLNFSLQLLSKEHLGIDLNELKMKAIKDMENDLKMNVKTMKVDKEKVN